ncbi:replication factor C subunit 4 [Nematostella vectensis]|uniref:replication factor C subunit 4 n=1 Tax=Nematostella vectensis TaxID=45351 RepID=UPI0020776334|nr:replication factor C subunit 4 [Nematostella vectensis]
MEAFLKGKTSASSSSKVKQGVAGSLGKQKSSPWVEKYRPKCVDDVAQQEEVVMVLKKSLEGADLPNLLFYGPPGTGKTSTILAVARELYGHEMLKQRVLELNASDERGIQVIRDKVKTFSQLSASASRPDGKPCPPFKLVILDEADSMTPSAQAALRRTMEKQTKTTRFCLICNYVSRIIEPLTSRCSKFRFKPLSSEILERRLKEICVKEEVNCEDKAIDEVIKISEGDMRKAITFLQSAHRLKGDSGIVAEDIIEIAGAIPDNLIKSLFDASRSDSYQKLEGVVKEIIAEGHAASQLIGQVHDQIVQMEDLNDHQKSAIMEKIAIVDKCLIDGADEYLQVLSMCSVMMQQFCHAG